MRPRRLPTSSGNQLLRAFAALNPASYAQLAAVLEPVSIERGTVLATTGDLPEAVYFVDSGVVSVLGHTSAGDSLELAFVGAEGVTSVGWLISGAPPPYSFVAQLPVTARRLDAKAARRLLFGAPSQPPRDLVALYAHFAMTQLAQSAICARFHTASERLSRWLLLTALRVNSNVLPLTHEYVAHMVGAPRSLVTEAAGTLRKAGVLAYRRGTIVIEDRRALEEHACECFPVLRTRLRTYERMLRSIDVAGVN
jgi:CRP-like cAMP-binding protein